EPYRPDASGIASRALKNVSLSYMMRAPQPRWLEVCHQQYQRAQNMTDVDAALRLLVNSNYEAAQSLREQVLQHFYETWRHEALVVNQWFAVQAASPRS